MRFWEVDFARGIAIILMVIFNWSFTLRYYNLFLRGGLAYWYIFPRFIAALFITIVGISLVLSAGRNSFKRGAKIFSLGLLITAATYIMYQAQAVLFGILHLIGLSIILSAPFVKFKRLNLLIGAVIILSGFLLEALRLGFTPFFWLVPETFITFDYFPLLPWFGFVLIGIFIGNSLYKNGKRMFKIKDLSKSTLVRPITFLGRNSLIIYLLHQPIMMAILLGLGVI